MIHSKCYIFVSAWLYKDTATCKAFKYSYFLRISNVKKVLFLLFLACKLHHIAQGNMARRDVKEESDYHGRGEMSIIV